MEDIPLLDSRDYSCSGLCSGCYVLGLGHAYPPGTFYLAGNLGCPETEYGRPHQQEKFLCQKMISGSSLFNAHLSDSDSPQGHVSASVSGLSDPAQGKAGHAFRFPEVFLCGFRTGAFTFITPSDASVASTRLPPNTRQHALDLALLPPSLAR